MTTRARLQAQMVLFFIVAATVVIFAPFAFGRGWITFCCVPVGLLLALRSFQILTRLQANKFAQSSTQQNRRGPKSEPVYLEAVS